MRSIRVHHNANTLVERRLNTCSSLSLLLGFAVCSRGPNVALFRVLQRLALACLSPVQETCDRITGLLTKPVF